MAMSSPPSQFQNIDDFKNWLLDEFRNVTETESEFLTNYIISLLNEDDVEIEETKENFITILEELNAVII